MVTWSICSKFARIVGEPNRAALTAAFLAANGVKDGALAATFDIRLG